MKIVLSVLPVTAWQQQTRARREPTANVLDHERSSAGNAAEVCDFLELPANCKVKHTVNIQHTQPKRVRGSCTALSSAREAGLITQE